MLANYLKFLLQNSQRANEEVDVDKKIEHIIKQKDDIIKKHHDLIQQKEQQIQEKDKEIKQLKKSLQESKLQQREPNDHQEKRNFEQKQKMVIHKGTQTDIEIQKNQPLSQEQRTKYKQENSVYKQTMLPYAEMCEVGSLPEYAVAYKPISMVVTLKDIHGRPITDCSDGINIKMQNTSTKQVVSPNIHVRELENGRHCLTFSIEEIGGYNLRILFNEKIIKASSRYICN